MKTFNIRIRRSLLSTLCRILLALSATLFFGCADSSLRKVPNGGQLDVSVITSSPFKHKLLSLPTNTTNSDRSVLHVYIEGDGRPWFHSTRISLDPTPIKTTVLELMLIDESPSIYLGRPCYFQTKDSLCAAKWWTNARYSEEVVQSMNNAINIANTEKRSLVLIGHSGGGTLATLIAARRSDVYALITIAANMDIEAWRKYHNYSPLDGSLNPADLPRMPSKIKQIHLAGDKDKNIPPEMLITALKQQSQADIRVIPTADHNCCWETVWPAILREIQQP